MPNIYSKGFDNNLVFIGALNGDMFILDINEFKFSQYSLNIKCVKNYLNEKKIKLRTIANTDHIISIKLDNTDYSRLYIVYANLGLFIVNIKVI